MIIKYLILYLGACMVPPLCWNNKSKFVFWSWFVLGLIFTPVVSISLHIAIIRANMYFKGDDYV